MPVLTRLAFALRLGRGSITVAARPRWPGRAALNAVQLPGEAPRVEPIPVECRETNGKARTVDNFGGCGQPRSARRESRRGGASPTPVRHLFGWSRRLRRSTMEPEQQHRASGGGELCQIHSGSAP
jgi:hypothetical protein